MTRIHKLIVIFICYLFLHILVHIYSRFFRSDRLDQLISSVRGQDQRTPRRQRPDLSGKSFSVERLD
jgi:hypothetical protein